MGMWSLLALSIVFAPWPVDGDKLGSYNLTGKVLRIWQS
jgi:hypothetical protein